MSLFCPKCWAKAKCTDSRCHALTNTVRRRYQCSEESCKYRFSSVEIIPDHIDLRIEGQSLLGKAIWQLVDLLGGKSDDEKP